ncbi:unnamed protein product [Ceutorhynchus assimilis]|uniref:Major facilitator superfamily (MFS) profile domain-containing protein n=1 Tax=Ceutorhynchus assimilis TaxID=467358 RepID=A0A9N9MWV0_9CUCU|nr:unnamed protein product [Ceutorhynchus assimilis]
MELHTTESSRCFEDYLKQAGWGLAYKFLIGVSCIAHFIRGVSFVAIAFAIALSSCNPVYYMGKINATRMFIAYFVGCGFGGLAGNSLGDRHGRKDYLIYSYLCIFASAFAAAFAFNVNVVIVAVMCLGAGLEVNATQTRLLVIEILTKEKRGFWIAFCELFWSLGYLLTAFSLIFFRTSTFLNFGSPTQPPPFWRVMFAISGGISLTMACVLNVVEESPRYWISAERSFVAYLILKKSYAVNMSKFENDFKTKEDDIKFLISPYGLYYREPEHISDRIKRFFWRLWKSIRIMFSKHFCWLTWGLMLIKMPIIVLGPHQLNVALGKYLIFDIDHKYDGLDFVYPIADHTNDTSFCNINEQNVLFNKYFLILGVATLPGQICCILMIDRLGRKIILVTSLLLAGWSFLTLPFSLNRIFKIVLTCLITASISVVILVVTLMNLELYPTALRGSSNSVTSIPSYIFAAFFLGFILMELKFFAIFTGILYCCLSSLACFLPELRGKPMIE